MRHSPPTTPLLAILRHLNEEQREEFADLAETKVAYLYQLAGCSRLQCRAALALKIEAASQVMAEKYGSEPINVATLATMCDCVGD